MASFPELYLSWNGVEYGCSLTIGTIRKIEREGSLLEVIQNLSGFPPKVSVVSWVIYCLLSEAGADVTEDEVWQEMRTNSLPPDYIANIRDFMLVEAFSTGPERKSKKQEADSEGAQS